jgi:transcriptional regulator of acetoin/glycerol metabolism
VQEKERKIRLETSMKMRAIYQERQRRWEEFRDSEEQRRIDKANVKEMNRLNNIIKESRARREYTSSKFQQTHNVRSYYQAALVIQRAYRRARMQRAVQDRELRREVMKMGRQRERAALVIQRAWRNYLQERLFRAMHFMSIMSGPVIAVERRIPSPPGTHSYEKGISITGLCYASKHAVYAILVWRAQIRCGHQAIHELIV